MYQIATTSIRNDGERMKQGIINSHLRPKQLSISRNPKIASRSLTSSRANLTVKTKITSDNFTIKKGLIQLHEIESESSFDTDKGQA
jgi:hypothetical protein